MISCRISQFCLAAGFWYNRPAGNYRKGGFVDQQYARMLNSVILVGRTVEDLKLVTTDSGLKTTRMVLACQRGFKNQETGEYDTDFIPVQLWQVAAEMVCEHCRKGSTLAVKARLVTRTIEHEGLKIKTVEVVGERVIFINLKRD
ncbi:MAG: single-stranded DNA-binding protein [Bacilli bacterium]|nr:single-stranded DNA-binding protein [Bacilli bacterium]HPZ27822.1 single-stranded DNA-binding protein [Bacilli bacterium]